MNKNGKKVLLSLAATMLLSTSIGQAASMDYKGNTNYRSYNSQQSGKGYVITYNNYSNNYLKNRYSNIIIRLTPKYWDNNNTNTPTKPEKTENPVEDNKSSDSDIDNSKDNNNKTPETKPSNPVPEIEEGSNTSIEMEVVRLVNIEREKAGLTPLHYSEELSKVARIKSQDMANKNYFSHTSPTYGDPFNMMRSFGIQYKTAGENIAKGYSNAKSVVNGWMNSSGHRANILNPSFGTIGVGYIKANGTTYWTQMFTN